MVEKISTRIEASCLGRGGGAFADAAVTGGCSRDAPGVKPGVRVEACRRVASGMARLGVFEVDDADKRGSGDSGFVEGDEESVTSESTTAEEVTLITEVEADSGGVLRLGVMAEGSTLAAEVVKVGIKRLLRKGTIDTREMRRSRPDATVHMSLC